MKIQNVRAIGLYGMTPEGGWSRDHQPDECIHTLVIVETDDGLTGLGSVSTNDRLVLASLDVLNPYLIGENALEPERVTEKLRQHMFWFGRGGAIEHTISGIDIAMWDILGKATSQPVGRLLGGRYRDRVRPYASLLMTDPGPLSDRLTQIKEEGFCAFKIGWGPFGRVDRRTDEAIVRTARDVVGDEADLMIDAGGSDSFWPNGFKWALRTSSMLADYGVAWFEEPLAPDAMDSYVRLRESAPVPIAGGEVLTRRQSFQSWIAAGAFDIVQPDVTKAGGLGEVRRVGWMAEDHDIRLIPHGWNTAVGLAADLHLASALPRTTYVEYISGSPYVDALAANPWRLDDEGFLPIPTESGLGIELDPDALSRYGRDRPSK